MNNLIPDHYERQQALDPTQSFIVQAPAGSGKTELLTQRFLVLLAHAKQPEEILAITFTKKSAAEMRARIILALKNAHELPEPPTGHTRHTWTLARSVLQQDQLLKWGLLNNPNRLRIQTIDSLNAYLTRQLPILSRFGATPDIVNYPRALYEAAVKEFLSHLEEDVPWSNAIAQLLQHLDNNLDKLEELLVTMLAKRDQWLPYISVNANDPALRARLEAPLAIIHQAALNKVITLFPKEHTEELLFLARFATQQDFYELPNDKKNWLTLSHLLLTKDFTWRKKIDKNTGFPPAEKALKQRMLILLNQLEGQDLLRMALGELHAAPDKCYSEQQWQTLHALHEVLCVVVAQLKCVFQQHNQIDFIENAEAAQLALGTADAPTDLTLALDCQIQHILIDEFQDTSNTQYRLLEKLTAGWENNDGRTLFVVGDPMQSIYRFREAEVGLYIRARQQGIGQLTLRPLTLSVNFRSASHVVAFINQHFKKVFPREEDIATGAVVYSPCIANNPEPAGNVKLHPFFEDDSAQQAESIIQLIQQQKRDHPERTIAILVRARTHLECIIPALKKAGIPYRALDIDPLDERPVIQDLMALTRALLHLADRIAWLAVLRAPWCGLSLNDLLQLSINSGHLCIWEQLLSDDVIKQLSSDGQQRLTRILPILKQAIANRARERVSAWVEKTWLALGGPACVTQALDLEDASAFFNLLEKIENGNSHLPLENLMEETGRLFAAPNHQADNSLQIMTLHNAKGLEFDTVILPHLERKAPHDQKQLLLWMEQSSKEELSSLVLAPITAIGDEEDLIYQYIKNQQWTKTNHEISRLLYVAVTRAKQEAHLFFNVKVEKNGLRVNDKSLLEKLWPVIKHEYSDISSLERSVRIEEDSQEIKRKPIMRLAFDWENPVKKADSSLIAYHQHLSGFQLLDRHAQYIGTLTHQILQQLCQHGAMWWQKKSSAEKRSYVQYHFSPFGLPMSATEAVLKAIDTTLQDTRGQWIIHHHAHAECEYRLTAILDGKLHSLIIDRTFVDDQGVRWIIDYKTSLEVDEKKHTAQMQQYYRAMQLMDTRPIRLGLYFPLVPAWRELTDQMTNSLTHVNV